MPLLPQQRRNGSTVGLPQRRSNASFFYVHGMVRPDVAVVAVAPSSARQSHRRQNGGE